MKVSDLLESAGNTAVASIHGGGSLKTDELKDWAKGFKSEFDALAKDVGSNISVTAYISGATDSGRYFSISVPVQSATITGVPHFVTKFKEAAKTIGKTVHVKFSNPNNTMHWMSVDDFVEDRSGVKNQSARKYYATFSVIPKGSTK